MPHFCARATFCAKLGALLIRKSGNQHTSASPQNEGKQQTTAALDVFFTNPLLGEGHARELLKTSHCEGLAPWLTREPWQVPHQQEAALWWRGGRWCVRVVDQHHGQGRTGQLVYIPLQARRHSGAYPRWTRRGKFRITPPL